MKVKIIMAAVLILTICLAGCMKDEPVGKEEPKEKKRVEVHTNPQCNIGAITVYAEGDKVFEYEGYINIRNNGFDGDPIEIVVDTKVSEEVGTDEGKADKREEIWNQ